MNPDEFADMAANEAYERATRAWVDAGDACAGDDEPLTPRQKVLLGTALLAQFADMERALRGMARTSDLLARLDAPLPSVSDEVEAWLAGRDVEGPLQ